ncbi:uncharacterized protein LOC144177789 [Haemaphysalis longicornis]|uniref:MARVEL domain-containing protein n=1 Tax=Haemaphysalis longicornis TaxID=44386 RepID=A0A9J6GH62_HAELO|nr:hypothetical protein HPB48_018987 [Haemaphysalis longicornis]
MAYYTGYIRTPSGVLKMFQILVGLVLVISLMKYNYDQHDMSYTFRLDTVLMAMTAFTFLLVSAVLLLCAMLDGPMHGFSVIYRMLNVFAVFCYLLCTTGYLASELRYGADWHFGLSTGLLCIGNTLAYSGNTFLAYKTLMD